MWSPWSSCSAPTTRATMTCNSTDKCIQFHCECSLDFFSLHFWNTVFLPHRKVLEVSAALACHEVSVLWSKSQSWMGASGLWQWRVITITYLLRGALLYNFPGLCPQHSSSSCRTNSDKLEHVLKAQEIWLFCGWIQCMYQHCPAVLPCFQSLICTSKFQLFSTPRRTGLYCKRTNETPDG